MEPEPSTLAGRVATRMAELGLSQADIARRGRFNATFVSDLLRGKKLTLRSGNYTRLARALLTTETHLRTGAHPTQTDIERIMAEVGWQPENEVPNNEFSTELADVITSQVATEQGQAPSSAQQIEELGRFPVYRSGGRFDGGSIVESFPLHHLTLPHKVQAKGLYAVAISDTSMSPRYEPGDLVYAHEAAQVQPKDYISIQVKGRANYRDVVVAYIRQLVHQSEHEVIVRQISPSVETRFARDSVKQMHRVLFAGEPIDAIGY